MKNIGIFKRKSRDEKQKLNNIYYQGNCLALSNLLNFALNSIYTFTILSKLLIIP